MINLTNNLLELTHVNSGNVSCDGGSKDAGHPLIYLKINNEVAICPYCSKSFTINPNLIGDNSIKKIKNKK